MSAADDEAWFESLAGRPRPGTDAVTAMEARMLRDASRAWKPLDALAAEPADLALLHARAARAGLLKTRGKGWSSLWGACASCVERWHWLRERPIRTSGWGLAFAAVLAAVVFNVMPPGGEFSRETEPVLRGLASEGVALLRDSEPTALRDRIATELAQAGAEVRRYERLGRFGLDAQLRLPPSADLAAVLDRYKLVPGKDGGLQVEIERASP